MYSDWHADHTTGTDYGKRAAEFIKAMKAVDPAILVTVVWVLEGEWNREEFEHTRDLADGVRVELGGLQAGTAKPVLGQWPVHGRLSRSPGPAQYRTCGLLGHPQQSYRAGRRLRLPVQERSSGRRQRSRPSYHAFKLASEALRGRLAECKVSGGGAEADLTCYLADQSNGRKALLLINKHPETGAKVTLDIPGFKGPATLKQIVATNAKNGAAEEKMDIRSGQKIQLPPYSATTIMVEDPYAQQGAIGPRD